MLRKLSLALAVSCATNGMVWAAEAPLSARTDLVSVYQEAVDNNADLAAALDERERFFAINERIHMRMLEMADNRWRSQMVADLRKVMKLNRHNSLLKQGRIEDSLTEHETILAALRARDPGATAEAMQAHFAHGLEAAG